MAFAFLNSKIRQYWKNSTSLEAGSGVKLFVNKTLIHCSLVKKRINNNNKNDDDDDDNEDDDENKKTDHNTQRSYSLTIRKKKSRTCSIVDLACTLVTTK